MGKLCSVHDTSGAANLINIQHVNYPRETANGSKQDAFFQNMKRCVNYHSDAQSRIPNAENEA